MSYDVSIFGTLQFKRGKLRAWQRLLVDSRSFRTISRTFPKKPHRDPIRVDALLGELQALNGASLIEVDESGNSVNVRGRFSQAAFESRARQLAALFLVAAEVEAEGDVCFLGDGVFVGYGVSLGGGRGVLMTLSPDQVQNASMDPELDVISGYFQVVPPAAPSSGVPRPSTVAPPSSGTGPRSSPLAFPSQVMGGLDANATGELAAIPQSTRSGSGSSGSGIVPPPQSTRPILPPEQKTPGSMRK
ncbi:MAG: hypothetical protein U0174_11690 [Polyangiaceae bacterium]